MENIDSIGTALGFDTLPPIIDYNDIDGLKK